MTGAVGIVYLVGQGLAALTSLDETRICEALMAGSIDFEGEVLEPDGLLATGLGRGVGTGPEEMALVPGTPYLAVTNWGFSHHPNAGSEELGSALGNVALVRLPDFHVVGDPIDPPMIDAIEMIVPAGGDYTFGIAVTPDGEKIYVTLGLDQPISVLDAASGKDLGVIKGTASTEEILLHKGALVVQIGDQVGQRIEGSPPTTSTRSRSASGQRAAMISTSGQVSEGSSSVRSMIGRVTWKS